MHHTHEQQTKLDYMFMFKKADMDIISMTMMVRARVVFFFACRPNHPHGGMHVYHTTSQVTHLPP